MKVFFIFLFLLIVVPFVSFSQSPQLYDESTYTLLGQGADMANAGQLYAIRYRSTVDTSYTLKKVYSDSTYSQLLSKAFYKGNLLDGPFTGYALDTSRTQPLARYPGMLVEDALKQFHTDTVTVQAYYKAGKMVGERITYRGSQMAQQGSFTNGVKVGVWKDFNGQGGVRRKTTYNNRGKKIAEEAGN